MLNKNKIVRNVIFLLFCTLILIVSGALTYYVAFYDETNKKLQLNEDGEGYGLEISSEKSLIKNKENENNEENEECEEYDDDNDNYTDLIGGLFYKFTYAFIAGSLLSDKCFLKLGLI